MIGQLLKTVCLVLMTAFVLTGCRQQYQKDVDVLAIGPDLEAIPVPSDYVSGAIVATGGLQEWARTTKLELDGVVTLYQPDGSFYLTEQHYQIYPWSNSISISAIEPQGRFVCELSQGSFSISTGAEVVNTLPSLVTGRDLADAILTITTAPIRFLDRFAEFTRASEPVRIQGQWYQAVEQTDTVDRQSSTGRAHRNIKAPELYWSKMVFCQNTDSSLVDVIYLADVESGKFFIVRAFDYGQVQKKGVLLPTKVEVFRTDAQGALPKRVAQVSFK
jgi:hypothetical protein